MLTDVQRCSSVSSVNYVSISPLNFLQARGEALHRCSRERHVRPSLSFLSSFLISFLLFKTHRLEAMTHPRCVGWGEMGLDYHYDNSPRDIQQSIFTRQLRNAVKLGKPITIHTREAEEDTERILKAEVPKDHKVSLDLVLFWFWF
jgi:Tat protein secretion system quality control protein TatD with DNase activity